MWRWVSGRVLTRARQQGGGRERGRVGARVGLTLQLLLRRPRGAPGAQAGTWQDVEDGDAVVHAQVVVRRVQLGRHPAVRSMAGWGGVGWVAGWLGLLPILLLPDKQHTSAQDPTAAPDPKPCLHDLEQVRLGIACSSRDTGEQ